ncbi:MAG: hypothetical protein JO154_18570 [Chitinophaga sp.]|uniref:hypothetical protein n=1 Tax=Chitinophaga sp. TaxID=1869181 RepID=UPI0025C66045|nr:hypothetical protein [Chitinophaga sp.]MBV8254612.1 hypothetical protein [Chitinophaga sp.]
MRKGRLLGTIGLCAFLLISCSKEMSTENDSPSSSCSYAPYTQGSSFTYLNVNQSNDSTSYTLTVNGDTTINGNVYRKIGDDKVFMCSGCANGIYTQIASILSFEGYTASDLRLTYLNDFLPVGSSWTDTIAATNNGATSTAVLQYTIMGKGGNRMVNGKGYTDVITIQTDASATVMNTILPLGTISTSYYAKGVGLIETDQAQDTTKLVGFTIK